MPEQADNVRTGAAVSGDENLVEIRDLCYAIGELVIFDELSLTVPRGRITAIMGPSGCGKTTLLRMIGGSLKPDRGRILLDGRDVSRLPRAELFSIRRRMGVLFQSAALFTDLNVFENVAFPMRVHTSLPEDTIRDLVLMKLNAVGLRGARELMPAELSGGMGRRVALARAIALDPDLIMYDEPFAGQDPIAMGVLLSLIRNLNAALGTTSLIVSHDIHETASIADRIYVLSAGGVIGAGAADVLKDHPEPEVRQFINGTPDGPVPFHYPAPDFEQDLLEEPGEGKRQGR
ncbi:MAG: ATP-binding cassette domain-containing protein [Gammaproteobacteria bacterium]|nr:ATP-binding cassette domain-containing protein [Gammaproteobacteria bacterium]MDE0365793.1 ATP-binding cassette domain-containing protein [Gammaproteobacteria bacterium]